MKYKKKPIVVEATPWFKNGDHPLDESRAITTKAGGFISEGKIVKYYRNPQVSDGAACEYCHKFMYVHGWIDTLEGGHIVCPGDFIITGVKGEMYPCKPDIFLASYDSER